jgi:hypothetical protein
MRGDFARDGWIRFAAERALADWVSAARPLAEAALRDPAQRAQGLVCEGTWFVGVDALPNDPEGIVSGVPLAGAARDFADDLFGRLPLHRAQVSVIWPGYPRPRAGETAAAFRYRQNRDAAHVDGLLAVGPDRRRMLKEPHAWILGLPLNPVGPGAAPLVVWPGSHRIMARAFAQVFEGQPPDSWADIDVTDIYQAARRQVFETCDRVEVSAQPGEAYLLHRMMLHGVAPWTGPADPAGRMIAYFRPQLDDAALWLSGG